MLYIDLWYHFAYEFRAWVDKGMPKDKEEYFRDWHAFLVQHCSIYVRGSGGSTNNPGNKQINPSQAKMDRAFHKTPQAQNTESPENAALMKACAQDQPLAFMFSMKNFLSKHNRRKFPAKEDFLSMNLSEQESKERVAKAISVMTKDVPEAAAQDMLNRVKDSIEFVNQRIDHYESQKRKLTRDDYMFIDYVHISHQSSSPGYNTANLKDLPVDNFPTIPNCASRNITNVSYMMEQHLEFTCKPISSFDDLCRRCRKKNENYETLYLRGDQNKYNFRLMEVLTSTEASLGVQ